MVYRYLYINDKWPTANYVTIYSFVLLGYSACFHVKKEVFGIPLDKDLLSGNVNFFKASEGYLESFPQVVYQLSITMRDKCLPCKIITKPLRYHETLLCYKINTIDTKLFNKFLIMTFLTNSYIYGGWYTIQCGVHCYKILWLFFMLSPKDDYKNTKTMFSLDDIGKYLTCIYLFIQIKITFTNFNSNQWI